MCPLIAPRKTVATVRVTVTVPAIVEVPQLATPREALDEVTQTEVAAVLREALGLLEEVRAV